MTAESVSGWKVAGVIGRRELVRFARQPARIAAAIGTPVILWLFMASGLGGALQGSATADLNYSAFLLPGAMTLIAVFSSIFAAISIIDDRNEGWLQAVLAAAAPRWGIALGKILGGAIVAFAQAAVLLLALPFLNLDTTAWHIVLSIIGLAATCTAMTALGVLFAWRSESTASFHAVMNLVFLPMWLLSGAFFPAGGASPWLAWLMSINPLTWCTEAIRSPLRGNPSELALMLAFGFAAIMTALATVVVARPVVMPR